MYKNRPFFYSNFVETVDGKVQVLTKDQNKYWPIGSKLDYQTLIELRASADVLIHGRITAMGFATLKSLIKREFKILRKKLGKTKDIAYIVLTRSPDLVLQHLKNKPKVPITVVTSKNAKVTINYSENITIERFGESSVDISKLSRYLHEKGFKKILVEGGPHTLGEFFANDLMDEVFVTIAPKIFGNKDNSTLTMVEGHLFKPKQVKKLKLISIKKIKDELYLRYGVI